jgi:signal transduction histidine kinase
MTLQHHDRLGTTRAIDSTRAPRVGVLLRAWRERRQLSQLELALEARVSARHLSFIETGRSRPSARMIARLADQLRVPRSDRNQLLLAGGYAPGYDDDHRHRARVKSAGEAVRARESAIDAARACTIAAADEARRQLERDLHDGAQQRFVLASLTLKRAVARARGTPAESLLAEAFEQLQQGLAELRDLAHGIHPAVLDSRGLAAALEDLAARSPLPVELRVSRERVAPAVEAAIYFTVAEALTNVVKHAHATRARVTLDIADGTIAAEIADDGIGGAGTAAGSGLRGLADRLDAIGGTLTITSPRRGGTLVRAHARVHLLGIPAQALAERSVARADRSAGAR